MYPACNRLGPEVPEAHRMKRTYSPQTNWWGHRALSSLGRFTVVLAALSCGGDDTLTGPDSSGPPAAMTIVSGNEQSGTVGTELPAPVVVRVTDADGLPVKGQIVNFRVVSGGGSVFAGAALTNDSGEARERWTLGTVAAEIQRLEARAVDPATGAALVFATFQAAAVAGAAAKLQKVGGDNVQGSVSTALSPAPSVKVVDKYDNPVGGFSVVFEVASGGGSVVGATQVTNSTGVATVGSWILGSSPGSNTLTATATGLIGSPATFTATANSVALVLNALSARDNHTCGLTAGGVAYCWGRNEYAQLGDGTTTQRTIPTLVQGGLTFTQLGHGNRHTCGLTAAGIAYCWGRNDLGQLGNGTNVQSLTPVAVQGGRVFTTLGIGGNHSCGLTSTGAAYCWGDNSQGGLGDGTMGQRTTPVAVQSGLTFTAIVTGNSNQTCALTTSGAAYCWGDNTWGALGDGTTTSRLTPVPVMGGHVFTRLTTQVQTCGLTVDGTAFCWGFNDSGQIGDGTTTRRLTPVRVQGGLTFTTLAAGNNHTCGLTPSGAAFCWGSDAFGAIGDGTTSTDPRLTPTAVQGGLSFASLVAGSDHVCGLTSTGTAYCWGNNTNGQLGDGTTAVRVTPGPIARP